MTSKDLLVGTTVEIDGVKYLILRCSKAIAISKEKQPAWKGSQNALLQHFVEDITSKEADFYFATEEWAMLRKKETGTVFSLNLLWKVRTTEEHMEEFNNAQAG